MITQWPFLKLTTKKVSVREPVFLQINMIFLWRHVSVHWGMLLVLYLFTFDQRWGQGMNTPFALCDLFHHKHLANVHCFQISIWTVPLALVLCNEWELVHGYQFIQREKIPRCFNVFFKGLILRRVIMVQLHWRVPNLPENWNRLRDWAVAFKNIAAWI